MSALFLNLLPLVKRARGLDDLSNVIAFITLLAEWVGYAVVAYWLFKFAVAL